MTRISDTEGSKFDAPLDVVWRYLQDPSAHGGAHKGSRNRAMTPVSADTFVVSWEQNMNGTWMKIANRITLYPPLGMAAEMIEGPMKGSRMFTVYTPHGSKTEVSVHGDMQAAMVPPGQLEAMVRAAWENAFNEDSEGIREFAKRK